METTTTRQAKCGCGRVRPSGDNTPLLEDLSPDAPPSASDMCVCGGLSRGGHLRVILKSLGLAWGLGTGVMMDRMNGIPVCANFTRREEPFDRFYCGCRGWD